MSLATTETQRGQGQEPVRESLSQEDREAAWVINTVQVLLIDLRSALSDLYSINLLPTEAEMMSGFMLQTKDVSVMRRRNRLRSAVEKMDAAFASVPASPYSRLLEAIGSNGWMLNSPNPTLRSYSNASSMELTVLLQQYHEHNARLRELGVDFSQQNVDAAQQTAPSSSVFDKLKALFLQ